MKSSTLDVEPHRTLEYLRATLAETYTRVDLLDCKPEGFAFEIDATQCADLSLTHFESVPMTFSRPQSLVRSSSPDHYVATLQLDTPTRYCSLNGRDVITKSGSITLYDLGRPFCCRSPAPCSGLDIHIPREIFERRFRPAARAVGLTITPEQPCSAVISAFFRNLMETADRFDPAMAARMSAVGIDLLAAGFAEQVAHEPPASLSSDTLFHRARMYIDEQSWDQNLNPAAIAAGMKLSLRRLQEVFAEHEQTIDAHLWDRRLVTASRRLLDPAYDTVPVARIGYDAGFSSASHFTRRFKQRFGMTPTDFREARAEGGRILRP